MMTGRLVAYARRRAGLSQRGLARVAGVPHSTVARIELGRLSPRADTLERLLRATGRTLATEEVLGADEDRSLIRDRLRLSPAARARLAVREARAARRLERSVRT
jgi:transcriptional regulator with XRE-family HTH domain